MKVKELIELLKTADPEKEVKYTDEYYNLDFYIEGVNLSVDRIVWLIGNEN